MNKKGFEKAISHEVLDVEGYILLSASEGFLKKNNNQTIEQAISNIAPMLALFDKNKIKLERIMFSCAFGDHFEGHIESKKVINVIKSALDEISKQDFSLEEITLADTTGYANPESVKKLIAELKSKFPELTLGLHLHDTRGLGITNAYAGLLEGVNRFDCSVGGMGGCPFVKNGAGNIATEDLAFMCEELGIKTGIDLSEYIKCAKLAEKIIKKPLPGKLKDSGFIK